MMKIGEVAKKAGVNVQTLRYYEKRQIVEPTTIKDSGYRLYTDDDLKSILFVKHAQELGFSLEEIKDLLSLRIPSKNRCQKVQLHATQKLHDVQDKIQKLQNLEKTLKSLINDCKARKTSKTCPIIESIEV